MNTNKTTGAQVTFGAIMKSLAHNCYFGKFAKIDARTRWGRVILSRYTKKEWAIFLDQCRDKHILRGVAKAIYIGYVQPIEVYKIAVKYYGGHNSYSKRLHCNARGEWWWVSPAYMFADYNASYEPLMNEQKAAILNKLLDRKSKDLAKL